MSILRPGGLKLTRYAIEKAALPDGAALLDMGCGDGSAVKYLNDNFNIRAVGIDKDNDAVERGKRAGANIKCGDASMLEFQSRSFDAVMMECVFSVLDRQEEAIHEAYCMLRPGGKLIISDVYCREPDMERFQREYREAMMLFRRPREHSECGSGDSLPSPFCQDGAVVMDGLFGLLDELELSVTLCEDHTDLLTEFLGQAIMDCGSLEAYFSTAGSLDGCGCTKRRDAGYFLLIAEKKA